VYRPGSGKKKRWAPHDRSKGKKKNGGKDITKSCWRENPPRGANVPEKRARFGGWWGKPSYNCGKHQDRGEGGTPFRETRKDDGLNLASCPATNRSLEAKGGQDSN